MKKITKKRKITLVLVLMLIFAGGIIFFGISYMKGGEKRPLASESFSPDPSIKTIEKEEMPQANSLIPLTCTEIKTEQAAMNFKEEDKILPDKIASLAKDKKLQLCGTAELLAEVFYLFGPDQNRDELIDFYRWKIISQGCKATEVKFTNEKTGADAKGFNYNCEKTGSGYIQYDRNTLLVNFAP